MFLLFLNLCRAVAILHCCITFIVFPSCFVMSVALLHCYNIALLHSLKLPACMHCVFFVFLNLFSINCFSVALLQYCIVVVTSLVSFVYYSLYSTVAALHCYNMHCCISFIIPLLSVLHCMLQCINPTQQQCYIALILQ